LTVGNELLQLTAPDDRCGLVYARGSFSNYPDAILARAQRIKGGKSTFGLKVSTKSGDPDYFQFDQESTEYEGIINFQWPYIELPMTSAGFLPGKYSQFSFVRDGTVFQIVRITAGKTDPRPTQDLPYMRYGQTIEEMFSSRKALGRSPSELPNDLGKDKKVKVSVGGKMRIDCLCHSDQTEQWGSYRCRSKGSRLMLENEAKSKRLVMQLFIDGKQIDMPAPKDWYDDPDNIIRRDIDRDVTFETEVAIAAGKTKLIVATFALRDLDDETFLIEIPDDPSLIHDLGLAKTSPNATDCLWYKHIDINGDKDYYDFCTGAATLQQILNVTSVPMKLRQPMSRRTSCASLHSLKDSIKSSADKPTEASQQLGSAPESSTAMPTSNLPPLDLPGSRNPSIKEATQDLSPATKAATVMPSSDPPPLEQRGSQNPSIKKPTHDLSTVFTEFPLPIAEDESITTGVLGKPSELGRLNGGDNENPPQDLSSASHEIPAEGSLHGQTQDTTEKERKVLELEESFGIALLPKIFGSQLVDLRSSL
jgi:hypothetical protein